MGIKTYRPYTPSRRNMTIYVSGEKSSLQQIMNLDEDF